MNAQSHWKPILAVTLGCLIVLLACMFGGLAGSVATWSACAGALIAQSSVLFLLNSRASEPQAISAPDELEQRRLEFESWQIERAEELQQLSHRLNEKHRSLAQQSARFQEFAEYPIATDAITNDVDEEVRLSEKDRQVHELLEKEAELVYERIRNNEYSLNGTLNIDKVREDALNLVQQVARIYSPNSAYPLLETSFEQLARAASRICLHSLVLLEQLPLNVKSYNVNEMYGYIRKAVQGYGAYQQAAPWIKRLSRGAYFGRFAAGANPVSLGAWWVATELGRRGAQKVVENIVDRQTVAVLHDIVTVVGVEAANIYGPGFRQRDPAWIYGTELTELLVRFPMSRESLSKGLLQITSLPLRSEYDRIYLYRCLAGRKSAGLQLSDPSVLTRKDREHVAAQLEAFYEAHIHGITEKDKLAWQEGVESRLDMKLKFGKASAVRPLETQATAAIAAVHAFLTSVAAVPVSRATEWIGQCNLMKHVPLNNRTTVLETLDTDTLNSRFEPPDLDPDSDTTEEFLSCLFEGSIDCGLIDDNIQTLLLETAAYFRRSQVDGLALLDASIENCLNRRKASDFKGPKLSRECSKSVLHNLKPDDQLAAAFSSLSIANDQNLTELSDSVLILVQPKQGSLRASVVTGEDQATPIWESNSDVTVSRRKGYLIDDCDVQGGTWKTDIHANSIVIAGSLTGGGFRKTFGSLQKAFPGKQAVPDA